MVTGEAILRTEAAHLSDVTPQVKALNLVSVIRH